MSGVMPKIEVQDLPLSESKSKLPLGHIRNRTRSKKSNKHEKLDTLPSKWTGGTASRLESGQLGESLQTD